MTKALPSLLFALAIGPGCQDPYRVPEREQASTLLRWAIENPTHRPIELWVPQGHTLVESSPAGSNLVDVTVEVTVHAAEQREAERLLRGVEQTRPRTTDKTLVLQVSMPLGAALEAVEMNYRVRVPADAELRIVTKTGRVALRGFSGRAKVESESGDVSARLEGGTVDLQSGTGTVRIEGEFEKARLASRSGPLELVLASVRDGARAEFETESGPVSLEMCHDLATTLDFRSATGKFDSELPFVLPDSTSRPASGERAFVGTLGARDVVPRSRLTVRTESSTFSARRLPDGTR